VRVHAGAGLESTSPDTTRYNVSWGFVEVLPDRVTILANDALKPEEIDVPRAQQQLEHGQKMWNEAGESEGAYDEALRVISEAEAKIASASEKH
jgi:F-type H+-transporting ATPase subunit epsilon